MATIYLNYPTFSGESINTTDNVADDIYVTVDYFSDFGVAVFEGDFTGVADTWTVYLPEGHVAVPGFYLDYDDGLYAGDLRLYEIFDQEGASVGTIAFKGIVASIEAVCFTAGTLVKTEAGPKAIETLSAGDLVVTRDHGTQPIRWIGKSRYTAETLRSFPHLRPIKIAAGALGDNAETRVSPHHRVLLSDWRAQTLFGEPECLAAARSLVNDSTITVDQGDADVEYFHILFDDHEIICADGLWSESFHPASLAQGTASEATRDEVLALFPELESEAEARPDARPTLSDQDVVLLGC